MDDIIDAIKSGDIEGITSRIADMKEHDHDTLETLLGYSPSAEVTAAIKKAFNSRSIISDLPVQDSSDEEKIYEDIDEGKAMKKYSKKCPKIDKAAQMFLAAFKANIKKVNYDRSAFLCFEIANYILEERSDSFPKVVRSKSHNLRENARLCESVYCGRVSPLRFVEMSASEMISDELKGKDEVAIKEGLLASQVAKAAAETNMFRCSRCKERKCTYSQLQTRSCDEPMTTFVHCTVCGNRWRF